MADLTPGVPSALSPLVRRIVAPNPGHMTGPGTNTYLVGIDEVAVIDPGPDSVEHVQAIIGASMVERVRWVLLTHTHPDHAPAAARLKKMTGAEILAFSKREPGVPVDRAIGDGAVIEGTEFGLLALHTPGHVPNHLCFQLEEERVMFTGDTVLNGMTSVIAPASGGDMAVYLQSLERIKKIRLSRICPGHGDVIDDPKAAIEEYIRHRAMRERQVLKLLKSGPSKISDVVAALYVDIPDDLREMAAKQIHAHLLKLRANGKVSGRDVNSLWKLS